VCGGQQELNKNFNKFLPDCSPEVEEYDKEEDDNQDQEDAQDHEVGAVADHGAAGCTRVRGRAHKVRLAKLLSQITIHSLKSQK
jgi:hypothetical protein